MRSLALVLIPSLCIIIVAMLLSSCGTKGQDLLEVKKDTTYIAKLNIAKEANRVIKWDIGLVSDEKSKFDISIFINGKSVHQSGELQGEYKIEEANTEIVFKLKNESGTDIQIKPKIQYVYNGSAGAMMATVRKNLTLSMEEK